MQTFKCSLQQLVFLHMNMAYSSQFKLLLKNRIFMRMKRDMSFDFDEEIFDFFVTVDASTT